jgi:CRISPR/Cas system-associated endonuclease Cas1
VAALGAAGLDAAVGFLYQARWGRPNLALELMEEFRPVVVDAVLLRCVNSGIVRVEEFELVPDKGCRMNPRRVDWRWRLAMTASPGIPNGAVLTRRLHADHPVRE